MIFEREYNFGLASKIYVMTNSFDSTVKSSYHKIMSLTALFPNNGRLAYLVSLYKSINSNGKIYIDEGQATAIISMATIVIPIMESYFIYLWREGNLKFNRIHMHDFMKKFEEHTFLEQAVLPHSMEVQGIMLTGYKLFPFRESNEWELAELGFSEIKPILEVINKITEARKLCSEIFLDPLGYLKSKNDYDKHSIITIKENPLHLIQTTAEEIKNQYYREFLD
ncbi:hypothetical protein D3C75_931880 [compost metagenome]